MRASRFGNIPLRRSVRRASLVARRASPALPPRASLSAQSVSPPIAEYQERARSSFQLINSTIFPLSVVLEVHGLHRDRAGRGAGGAARHRPGARQAVGDELPHPAAPDLHRLLRGDGRQPPRMVQHRERHDRRQDRERPQRPDPAAARGVPQPEGAAQEGAGGPAGVRGGLRRPGSSASSSRTSAPTSAGCSR